MKVFHTISSVRQFASDCKVNNLDIGLVPTMGALHEGHAELIKTSKANNSITIVSIFINPTQFNQKEDLDKYPRNLDEDLIVLKQLNCDAVFCPGNDEIYLDNRAIKLNVGHFDNIMEGKYRPGHFEGVALIVTKLFNIVDPTRAYFGQKDFQQLALIRQLVVELDFNLEVVSVPTVRESSGLAMSSRNQRLEEKERLEAAVIFKGLKFLQSNILNGMGIMKSILETKKFYTSSELFDLEYLEVVDLHSLRPVTDDNRRSELALCVAGNVGAVRLLDNIVIA